MWVPTGMQRTEADDSLDCRCTQNSEPASENLNPGGFQLYFPNPRFAKAASPEVGLNLMA